MTTMRLPFSASSLSPLLFLGMLLATVPVQADDKHIDVAIQDAGGVFKLEFQNSACPHDPGNKGCVLAERGNAPVISWKLVGATAEAWQLTRLQFSPDGEHWGDPGAPLLDCTVEDFALTPADRLSGTASTARVTADGGKLQIKDENRNQCITHYKLFAAPRAGGGEIDSDPVIDNRGRN